MTQEEIPACVREYFRVTAQEMNRPGGYLGVCVKKNPVDLFVMQRLIHQTNPERVVETGTKYGGSALAWASVFELMGTEGKVITVDINPLPMPQHGFFQRRVECLVGDSVDHGIVREIAKRVEARRTMVILDSKHKTEHVYQEMCMYAPLVSEGCYMVVEDGIMRRGPYHAIERFLGETSDFVVDGAVEPRFTFNPKGYLRRVTGP